MIKKISIAITVLVIALMIAFGVKVKQAEAERTVRMAQINEQAELYEEKIAALESEIEERRAELYTDDKGYGNICLTAKISSSDELEQVYDWVYQYKYPWMIILDIDMEEGERSAVIRKIASNSRWNVMLTGSGEDWLTRAESIRQELAEKGLEDCGIAYFTEAAEDWQIEEMSKSSWKGYSNSLGAAAGIQTTMSDTGLSQIGHIVLTDNNSLRLVAEESIANGSLFLLSIEMEYLNRVFTGESVERILASFEEEYIEPGLIVPVSMKSYMEEFESGRAERVQKQAEFDAFAEKKQAEIDRLEAEMMQLYEELY